MAYNNPELQVQRIPLMFVKSAVEFCSKNARKFSRHNLADISTYVREYKRYALAREI